MSTCSFLRGLLALSSGAALASAVLFVEPARAQAEDQAAARALFDEGRRLIRAGQYEQACPKFQAASKLYPGPGVLLNLGDCYEHTNRTASAWTEFGEAASSAVRAGRKDDEAEARRRQQALEPRLSRLVIHVVADAPGLVVSRDGTALDRAIWNTPVPIDPGSHSVLVEAAGHARWTQTVAVTEPGRLVTVEVPELAASGASTPASPAIESTPPPGERDRTTEATPYWTGRRTWGAGIGGIGLVAMGVGGALGLAAKAQDNTAMTETGSRQRNDSSNAVSNGNAATAVVGVGAAVLVAGLVIWLAAPRTSTGTGTAVLDWIAAGTF